MVATYPFREIWLEPFCPECWTGSRDITWCQDKVYDPCAECGRSPIRYVIDRRQRKPVPWLDIPDGSA